MEKQVNFVTHKHTLSLSHTLSHTLTHTHTWMSTLYSKKAWGNLSERIFLTVLAKKGFILLPFLLLLFLLKDGSWGLLLSLFDDLTCCERVRAWVSFSMRSFAYALSHIAKKHIIGSVQIDLRSFYQALTRTNTHEETKRDQDKKWFLKLGSFVVVVDVVVVVVVGPWEYGLMPPRWRGGVFLFAPRVPTQPELNSLRHSLGRREIERVVA